MNESLVILGKSRSPGDIDSLATVTQRYGERVLIVTTAAPERLAAMDGVTVHALGELASGVDDDLNETEQMGVAAWNSRVSMQTKSRSGDGLSWDAKGFKAP